MLLIIVSIFMLLHKYMNAEPCWYVIIGALLGPLENFTYTPSTTEEVEGVVTNLTCAYGYNCTVDVIAEASCTNFSGNAVVTCIIRKNILKFYLLIFYYMEIHCDVFFQSNVWKSCLGTRSIFYTSYQTDGLLFLLVLILVV